MTAEPEMVRRLKAELATPGPRWRRVEVADGIGWIPCPCCKLPFLPGSRLYFDTETKQGHCEGCAHPDAGTPADDEPPY